MADKGSGLGDFFGGIGNAVSTGVSDVGQGIGNVASGVGNFFTGSPSSTQSSQALSPTTPSLPAALSYGSDGSATTGTGGGNAPVGVTAPASIALPDAGGADPTATGSGSIFQNASSVTQPVSTNPGQYGALSADQLAKTGTATAPGAGSSTFQTALAKYGLPASLAIGSEVMQSGQNAKALKGFKSEQAAQQGIANNARSLATAEQEGILPPGAQQSLQAQLSAARAATQAKYADMGMTGSSAESQDLQNLNTQAIQQQFQLGQAMATQGLTEASGADANSMNLMKYVADTEAAQGTDLSNVLSKFAAMFAGAS